MYTFHNLFGLKRAYQKENISLLTLTQLSMILDYSSENNSVMSLKQKLPKLKVTKKRVLSTDCF